MRRWCKHLFVAALISGSAATQVTAQSAIPGLVACPAASFQTPGLAALTNMVSADFNADGTPDVAFADVNSGQVFIVLMSRARLAVGDCAGGIVINTEQVGGPVSVAAGDLEGNGTIDLAVATQGGVILLRNGGAGDFTADANPVNVGLDPRVVALADLDGDGRTDVIVGNGNTNRVTIAYAATTGFEMPVELAADGAITSLVVADLDRDSFSDIAAVSSGSGVLSVFLQEPARPRPMFRLLPSIAVGVAPSTISIGDFNADAAPDLAIPSGGSSGVLNILLNQLPENEQTPFVAALAPEAVSLIGRPTDAGIADFNRDFFQDVVVTGQDESTISFFLNDGTGHLRETDGPCGSRDNESRRCKVGDAPRGVAVVDVDGDGRADVITANQNSKTLTVLLSGNPQTPTPTPIATASRTISATVSPTATLTAGPCGVPHAGGGCDSVACQTCVCDIDTPCCETGWDETCVARGQLNGECEAACAQTPTPTKTSSPTETATLPPSPTATATISGTPATATATGTVTPTPPPTPIPTRTAKPTQTATITETATRTVRPSNTPGPTESPTPVCLTGGVCVSGKGCAIVAPVADGSPTWVFLAAVGLALYAARQRRA